MIDLGMVLIPQADWQGREFSYRIFMNEHPGLRLFLDVGLDARACMFHDVFQ